MNSLAFDSGLAPYAQAERLLNELGIHHASYALTSIGACVISRGIR